MLWLGAAGLASASFVGVEAELVDATEYGWTYRVYASFDAFDDEAVAVYGWAPAPMTLTVQAPLFQSPSGGPTAEGINPLFLRRFPIWPTTVGSRWGSEDAGGTSALNQAGMEASFDAFEAGEGFVLDDPVGGTWFITPGSSTDAFAGEDGKVLLGQMTVTGLTEWVFNVQYFDANGDTQNAEGLTVSIPQGVNLGCTDPRRNFDAGAVAEDGSCEYLSCAVYGCMDPIACNYISTRQSTMGGVILQLPAPSLVHADGGSFASRDAGHDMHRYYVNMLDATDRMSAVYGNNDAELSVDAPSGVFNSPYNASWNASGINPIFAGLSGFGRRHLCDGWTDRSGLKLGHVGRCGPFCGGRQQPAHHAFLLDGRGDGASVQHLDGFLVVRLEHGLNGAAGAEQRVLVMQVTSAGNVSGQLNYKCSLG